MFRKQALLAPFVASALVTAIALLGCDGAAHGTDLYGGTSGSSGTTSSGGSSGTDPGRTCTSGTLPGDSCPRTGEGTCYANNGTLVCVDGTWTLDPTTIDFPPPPPPLCPAYEPYDGQPCYQTTGYDCSFYDSCPDRPNGASPSRDWQCTTSGIWQRRNAYVATCPSRQPQNGDSCAECRDGYPAQCTYFDGKSCGPAVLSCDPKTMTWSQLPTPCPPPQDAGAGP